MALINSQRSNHNWGMAPRGTRCSVYEMRIDASIRRVQPPDAVRGDIARIMQDTYGFRLGRQDRQLYVAWSNADLPDSWEIDRNKRITRVQGKANEFVSSYQRL